MSYKKGFKPIPPYLTNAKDGNEPYIRITSSLYLSPLFKKITYSAKCLFIDMCLYVGVNYDESFTYPETLAKRRLNMSRQTFLNSRDLLVENGFIEVIECNRNLRKPNLYKLSMKWRFILQEQGYNYDIRKRSYNKNVAPNPLIKNKDR